MKESPKDEETLSLLGRKAPAPADPWPDGLRQLLVRVVKVLVLLLFGIMALQNLGIELLAATPFVGGGEPLLDRTTGIEARGGSAINDHLFEAMYALEQRQGDADDHEERHVAVRGDDRPRRRHGLGAGDIGKQLGKCLENLSAALGSAGANLDQVGALTLYIKQSHMSEGRAIGEVLKSVFGANLPCSTWIGVTGLAVEDFLIEVEPSVVFLPKKA